MTKLFTFLVLALILLITPALAQDDSGEPVVYGLNDLNYTAGPRYNVMATELMEENPKHFDFDVFRSQYAMTRQYDPLGEVTRRKMINLAYKVSNEKDPAKQADALKKYQAIVFEHLANMGILIQAQALARQDKRLGDVRLLERIYSGLLYSVMHSGNGESLNTAYNALTPYEESAVLTQLGVKVVESFSRKSGIYHYTMHDVEDPATGRKYTVFIDTTKAMEFLAEQERTKENVYNIRKQ